MPSEAEINAVLLWAREASVADLYGPGAAAKCKKAVFGIEEVPN